MSAPSIDYETWILVADGQKALFLQNMGDAEIPNFQVRRVEERENPADREQGASQPGRRPDTGPSHMSALEETDWHQLEKERFAGDLAEILYKMAHKNRFEKLVLVAPPRVLGDLRPALHKEVQDRIVGEVDKDYTGHPIDQIERLLKSG